MTCGGQVHVRAISKAMHSPDRTNGSHRKAFRDQHTSEHAQLIGVFLIMFVLRS